jgi:hypothetical protein
VSDYKKQVEALWRVQGKDPDRPWIDAKRRKNAQQCTACGAIFGGVWGFTKHRRGGRCNDPTAYRMRQARDGVWVFDWALFHGGNGVISDFPDAVIQE